MSERRTREERPHALPGVSRGLLALVPAVMLVSGVLSGYWPVALAAVPALVFFLAAAQALVARASARETLLGERDLGGAQPAYRRSAVCAVVAIAALVVAVLVLNLPA